MADRETPLTGASMDGHSQNTGFVPSIIRRHPNEHSVGIEPQKNYNVPNDNKITEVMQNLLWRVMSWVLLQISGHPLTPIRFFQLALPSKSTPVNNHDH